MSRDEDVSLSIYASNTPLSESDYPSGWLSRSFARQTKQIRALSETQYNTAGIDLIASPKEFYHFLLIGYDRSIFHRLNSTLTNIMGNRFRLDWAIEEEIAQIAIFEPCYDLLFVDFRVRRKPRFALFSDHNRARKTAPIILISCKEEFRQTRTALKQGATDYIFHTELVAPVLDRVLRYSLEHKETRNGHSTKSAERDHLASISAIAEKEPLLAYESLDRSRNMSTPANGHGDRKENALSSILNTIPHSIFWKNNKSLYLGCNENFVRLVGTTDSNSIIGRTDSMIAWRDQELARILDKHNEWVRSHACPKIFTAETDLPWKSGHSWLGVTIMPLYDDNGKVNGVFGILEDITDHERARKALRESEARLRLLLDQLPATVWTVDSDLHFQPCGHSALPNFLVRHEHSKKASLFEVFQTDNAEDLPIAMAKRALEGESVSYQLVWEGSVYQVIMEPLREPDRRIIGAIGLTVDVSEKHKLETRMQQAQKLESLGVLARGVAHDFNNLLSSILGNLDLVKVALKPDSIPAKRLSTISAAAEHASDLSNQLLAYAGKGSLFRQKIRLSDLILDMKSLLNAAVTSGITIDYECAEKLSCIEADPTQISQIVMNLVVNASEAIADTRGTITIRTTQILADSTYFSRDCTDPNLPEGDYVCLEVSDTGSGIPESTRQRIFDPFFTTKVSGRGFGLATVLAIMRSHNGAIKVSSTTGRGSSFQALFPAD